MSATGVGDYLSISYLASTTCYENANEIHSNRILPFAASPLYNVEILSTKRLTKGEDVNMVYDIALNVEDINYDFEPGDTIGIIPKNNREEVDKLFERLNLTDVAKKVYSLNIIPNTTKKKAAIPLHIPPSGTLLATFMNCIDVRSVPKKLFLRSLLSYTTALKDIELLQQLCSPGGSQNYNEFITKHTSLLSVLEALPSCNPPVTILLENLPPLQPRPYSISSSPLCSKKELHITFAVININENTKGVCTSWLESCVLKVSPKNSTDKVETMLNNLQILTESKVLLPFYFRKNNNFRLPTFPSTPIIMIGPGTGVAPFVGFLEHRSLQTHVKFGTTWLLYGCRYSNRDYLFKDELNNYQRNGTLTKLFVGFSRENNKKEYVQDLILKNMNEFVDLIQNQNAVVYVCGDAQNMLKDIRAAIVHCLMDVEKLSNEDAEIYVKEMEQTNRYIKDVWL